MVHRECAIIALLLIGNGWYNIYHKYWSKESGRGNVVKTGVYKYIRLSLHDFPSEYRLLIINQLIKNLKPAGRLYIRKPLGINHGIRLHELINLLEYAKSLFYEYEIVKSRFAGEYVEINASLKIDKVQ